MASTTASTSASRVWWSAVRPATLAASVAPVLAGTAVAVHQGGARWWAGVLALVVALAMQVGVNLANDYSDFARGADANRVGPLRASSSGMVDPAQVRTAYVETGRITTLSVLLGCGVGFLAAAILLLNNLRDIETDAAAGKRTLATRLGRQGTRILLLVLVSAAFAVPIVIFLTKLAGVTVMAMHFGIPIASMPVRTAFATTSAPELVKALRRMAVAEMAYSLLFTIGILL